MESFDCCNNVFTYLANSISYRSWDDIILKSSLLVSLLIIVG